MHPREFAQNSPETAAVIMSDGTGQLTYLQLERLANQGAQLLRLKGIQAGDTIALCLRNCPEFFAVYWAAQRAGLHIRPIATHLKPEEVSYILHDSGARLLVTDRSVPAAQVLLGQEADLGLTSCEMIDREGWSSAIADMPDEPIKDEAAGIQMLYSSGTTGKPKGIRASTTGGPACAPHPRAQQMEQTFGFGPGSKLLTPAPLYHAAPLVFSTMPQRLGSTIVVMPKFDAEEVLRLVELHQITFMQMVPTMFVRLLNLPEATRAKYDISSLTHVLHAAAPCPLHIKHAMLEWFGQIIYEYYAGSEGNGSTSIGPEEWLERPGSVGKAQLGIIHICDDEGRELPVGTDGLIYFEGGPVFEYWNDPDKTKDARHPTKEGWSSLGDIGHVDDEGYLFLTDRKSFTIISGGVNIYPQEVENLLIQHPEVADVAVIGVPNAEMGEEVKAIVEPANWSDKGDALADRLLTFCREHLSHVKCPRSIDFDRQLPREETGKLYKRKLRERYLEQ